jgi:hypothetical protein
LPHSTRLRKLRGRRDRARYLGLRQNLFDLPCPRGPAVGFGDGGYEDLPRRDAGCQQTVSSNAICRPTLHRNAIQLNGHVLRR